MKKSLIAMAALAATSAFAQSSVTLYGIVEANTDIGFKSTTTVTTNNFFGGVPQGPSIWVANPPLNILGQPMGASGVSTTVVNPGFRLVDGNAQGQGSSRFGMRGTEDLGGGLKANFQLEAGINVNNGTVGNGAGGFVPGAGQSNLFSRQSWVGLSGGFGEVRLGRQLTGAFLVQLNSSADATSNGLYGVLANTLPLMGGVRFSNSIRYITPDLGGFSGSVALQTPESTTTSGSAFGGAATPSGNPQAKTGVDLAVEYKNGPAYIGFGYNKRNNATNTTNNNLPGAANLITTQDTPVTGYTIGASYDLGVAKPFLNYSRQTATSSAFANGNGFVIALPNTANRIDAGWALGVRVPVGAFTIISSYGRNVISGNYSAVVGGAPGAPLIYSEGLNGTIKAFNLGAQYALSKRTSFQANYGQNTFNSNENGVASNAAGVVLGSTTQNINIKQSGLSVGVRHQF